MNDKPLYFVNGLNAAQLEHLLKSIKEAHKKSEDAYYIAGFIPMTENIVIEKITKDSHSIISLGQLAWEVIQNADQGQGQDTQPPAAQ